MNHPLPTIRGVRQGQEHMFPPAAHILNAENNRDRAAMLVRLPDGLVVTHGGLLVRACEQAGFSAGANYLHVRLAALLARREADGRLPAMVAAQLRFWTDFMAGGAGP